MALTLIDELRRRFPHLDFDGPADLPTGHPRLTLAEQAERAVALHERRTPAEFRHAEATRPEIAAWADRFATRDRGGKPGLLLVGPTGTGKTYQAYGALRRIATSGHPQPGWHGGLVSDLYRRLRGDEAELEYHFASTAPILLLDDIGAAKESAWTEETVHRLIDHRCAEHLPVIVTGNVNGDQLVAKVGDRIASRLAGMCHVVGFNGADRRRSQP